MSTSKALRQKRPAPQVGIRLLREAYGLSLPALSTRIAEQGVEVSPDHMSNCELGWKRPSQPLLHAWCKALGITRLDVLLLEAAAEEQAA
jgi:hypothetical protein